MGLGTEVFTVPGSRFTAVCINPVEDTEKIREITERYSNGLIDALKNKFGEYWATTIINDDECLKILGCEGEELKKILAMRKTTPKEIL